jgi:hypothetical protein
VEPLAAFCETGGGPRRVSNGLERDDARGHLAGQQLPSVPRDWVRTECVGDEVERLAVGRGRFVKVWCSGRSLGEFAVREGLR